MSNEKYRWKPEHVEAVQAQRNKLPKTKRHPKQGLIDDMVPLEFFKDDKPLHLVIPENINFEAVFNFIQKKITDLDIQPSQNPEVLFVVGLPASGKKTFIEQSAQKKLVEGKPYLRDNAAIGTEISNDQELLNSFHLDPSKEQTNPWKLANFISNELMRYALSIGATMAWKSSGAEASTQETIKKLGAIGYKRDLVVISRDLNKSWESKQEFDNAHTNPKFRMQKEQFHHFAEGLYQNLPEMLNGNEYESKIILDNNGEKDDYTVAVTVDKKGKTTVYDLGAYDEFAKTDYKIEYSGLDMAEKGRAAMETYQKIFKSSADSSPPLNALLMELHKGEAQEGDTFTDSILSAYKRHRSRA